MHPSKFALNVGFLVGASMGVLFPNLFQCKHENTQSIVVQNATCEKQGVMHVVCGKCDKTVSEDIIDVLGHSFGEPIVLHEPGPNKNGAQKRICETCNEEEISPIICSHEEGLIEILWESTCFDVGRERKTCQDCQTVMERDLPLEEHSQTVAFVTREASCFEPGLVSHICTECFSAVSTEEIALQSHSFGDWITSKTSTPWDSGYQYRICNICGYKESQEKAPVELGENVLYIPTLEIQCDFGVGRFTQAAVNANDVLYTDWAYRCEDVSNPFVLGHNYGFLGTLYNLKVGEHVYLQLDGIIYDYLVINSEYAVESGGISMVGQTTGVSIWDTYSGSLSSEMPEPMQGEGKDRRVNNAGRTLHMYTCYYGKDKPEWESSHGRNGRWIVIADLVKASDAEIDEIIFDSSKSIFNLESINTKIKE